MRPTGNRSMNDIPDKTDYKPPSGEEWQAPIPAYVILKTPFGQPAPSFGITSGFIRYRWFITAIMLITTALSGALAFYLPPVYRATVLIHPVTQKQGKSPLRGLAARLGGLAALSDLGQEGNGTRQESLAVLRSRHFTLRFMREEKLLPLLFEERWDKEKKRWIDEPDGGAPSDWEAYERFDQEVRRIAENHSTGLVTLSIDLKDRDAAARWANLLVERVNRHLKEKAIEEANKSLEYLNRELDKTNVVEIRNMIYKLMEIQINRIMLANVREEYAFEIIDPAVPPDEDHYVSPRPGVLLASGIMGGLLLGLMGALMLSAVRNMDWRNGDKN